MADTDNTKASSPIRLDHAAVMTTDLERAIAFYTDVLGFRRPSM